MSSTTTRDLHCRTGDNGCRVLDAAPWCTCGCSQCLRAPVYANRPPEDPKEHPAGTPRTAESEAVRTACDALNAALQEADKRFLARFPVRAYSPLLKLRALEENKSDSCERALVFLRKGLCLQRADAKEGTKVVPLLECALQERILVSEYLDQFWDECAARERELTASLAHAQKRVILFLEQADRKEAP